MRWSPIAPALLGLGLLARQSTAADAPAPSPAPPSAPAPTPPAPSKPPVGGKAPPTTTPASAATAAKGPAAKESAKAVSPPAASAEGAPAETPAQPTATATAATESSPASPTDDSATASAPPPPAGPPQYYVEPQPPAATSPTPGAESVLEPPLPAEPIYEPPPPTEPRHRAPKTALWLGARVGWLIPFGSLWLDGFGGGGLAYRKRTFASYAAPGPAGEIDVGARLSRRYMVFALFEHASFGAGSLDDSSFGGQNRGASNLYGAGLRFTTDPDDVGFAMEFALGYRDFHAYWADGTELAMTNGFLDGRLGLGADIRVNGWLSLSPMLVLGGGSFGTAQWSGPRGSYDALNSLDQPGEYGTLALTLGGHIDVR